MDINLLRMYWWVPAALFFGIAFLMSKCSSSHETRVFNHDVN